MGTPHQNKNSSLLFPTSPFQTKLGPTSYPSNILLTIDVVPQILTAQDRSAATQISEKEGMADVFIEHYQNLRIPFSR